MADPDGADAEEVEEAAYIPGELLVKSSDTTYQEGDIVASMMVRSAEMKKISMRIQKALLTDMYCLRRF